MKLSKIEATEYSLLAAFAIGTFVLKITHHLGFLALFGCVILLALMVVWILGYKEYPLVRADGKKLVWAFVWSFYARLMLVVACIFTRCNYAGGDIMVLVAMVASLSYIIFAGCKHEGGEDLKLLLYFFFAM